MTFVDGCQSGRCQALDGSRAKNEGAKNGDLEIDLLLFFCPTIFLPTWKSASLGIRRCLRTVPGTRVNRSESICGIRSVSIRSVPVDPVGARH